PVVLQRAGECGVSLVEAPGGLQREREVVKYGHPGALALRRTPELLDRLVPARLAQRDQPEMELRHAIVVPQFVYPPEFTFGLDQHAGAVEGNPEIAMFIDPRKILARRRRGRRAHAPEPARR